MTSLTKTKYETKCAHCFASFFSFFFLVFTFFVQITDDSIFYFCSTDSRGWKQRKKHHFLHAKPWIPDGDISIFTAVIHKWKNCGDVTVINQKRLSLATMAESAIDNCFSRTVCSGHQMACKKSNVGVTRDAICQWFPLVTSSLVKIIVKSPHSWPQNRYSR